MSLKRSQARPSQPYICEDEKVESKLKGVSRKLDMRWKPEKRGRAPVSTTQAPPRSAIRARNSSKNQIDQLGGATPRFDGKQRFVDSKENQSRTGCRKNWEDTNATAMAAGQPQLEKVEADLYPEGK